MEKGKISKKTIFQSKKKKDNEQNKDSWKSILFCKNILDKRHSQ